MVRCIPAEPEFGEGQLAEKAVWESLRNSLPEDAVVAHSVLVRHGRAEHEIDLLVLWPGVGMAAIEVKGGRIAIKDGQWQQSDRGGWRKIQSPVAQSQNSMHAFKDWLSGQASTPLSSRFAYMVALPYTPVPADWAMAGCPRSLILDQMDVTTPAERIRAAIEQEGGGASPLAPAYLERIIQHLSGNLGSPTTAAGGLGPSTGAITEDLQDHLTQRQQILLAATRSLPRIKFTGGAGSGKTWLAVEKAATLSKAGKRVGLFCYNKGLGQYLQNRVNTWRHAKPAFTGEFHAFVTKLGVPNGTGPDYFENEMPRLLAELAAGLPDSEKFDAVVIDEAQDFAPSWWDALLACMKDPEHGEVYAFMDDRQDVYKRWGGPGETPNQLADLVPIHIDENLRNTRKIAESFKPFASEFFTPRGGTGLPVRLVGCATDEALDVAADCVDALIEEGWANNQMALLTTKNRHPIHQEHFDNGTVEEYWREFHANEAEFYGHVLGFKGLERSVVILCVNGFKDLERAAEQLYVGLSRARSLLVVVGSTDLLREAGGNQFELALNRAERWAPQVS
ncbi:nuclease-related domain-containing DEAD/DEAH box helicase [Arthrobacter sp. 35W]|uniref:nuclease-related domain-containing DEAD/DEAH box helicase n=1 Tax=Arthrobacter sp. 35W TaxID=1132441 RepID=UPI0004237F1D|nr:nuclease-related domain-containing protein [Arthrobacter sp. 35W]